MARKAKQAKLLDNTPEQDVELVKLIEAYEEVRDDRMAALVAEVRAGAAVLDALKARGLTEYSFDGKVARIRAGKEKVSVRKLADEDGAEETAKSD